MAKEQDLLFHIGHRDRLRQKFLDGQLSDDELLELLLADVIPRRDVRPLARGLMQKFGGLSGVLSAPMDDLLSVPGLGRNTCIHLKLVNRIMARGYKEQLVSRPIFHDNSILINYCLSIMSGKSVEEFHVLYLDKIYRLLSDEVHSIGTIDWAPVFEREIIKRGLNLNACYVVLVHNHPTNGGGFSVEDIHATTKLEEMLNMVGLKLYDHYVVSAGIVHSARAESFLNKSATSHTSITGS